MGATKKIPKNWREAETIGPRGGVKTTVSFAELEVVRSEDLPKLMTTKEAAQFLRRHPKTIEEYRKEGSLKFCKLRGRYFTTPEFIAEFLEAESKA